MNETTFNLHYFKHRQLLTNKYQINNIAVHENLGYGEVTGGIVNSKRKKKKKQRAEPQIEDANQYKLYNDAQYDQQAHDSDGTSLSYCFLFA